MRTVFRLFVSSAFNDFHEERKLLQEDVFLDRESKKASLRGLE